MFQSIKDTIEMIFTFIAAHMSRKVWMVLIGVAVVLIGGNVGCHAWQSHNQGVAATQARHRLMMAEPGVLAVKRLVLPSGPVAESEREQVRLTGGQFPLLVDDHDQPVVSFVHYPRVDLKSIRMASFFRPKKFGGKMDVVQGIILHNVFGDEFADGTFRNVSLDRTVGHYGTFDPRGWFRGPIREVVVVPNIVGPEGVKPNSGFIILYTMKGAVMSSELLSTGELLVLVQPAGHKPRAKDAHGDDDDSAGDDDDSAP